MENNFPNASEFSPNVIELDKLLELCKKMKENRMNL